MMDTKYVEPASVFYGVHERVFVVSRIFGLFVETVQTGVRIANNQARSRLPIVGDSQQRPTVFEPIPLRGRRL